MGLPLIALCWAEPDVVDADVVAKEEVDDDDVLVSSIRDNAVVFAYCCCWFTGRFDKSFVDVFDKLFWPAFVVAVDAADECEDEEDEYEDGDSDPPPTAFVYKSSHVVSHTSLSLNLNHLPSAGFQM